MRGINYTTKIEEVVDIFKKGKFKLPALTETKLKGGGGAEVSWCGVNSIISSVQEMERGREGVPVLLNEVWHSALVKSGCFSSRILWIKFKFSRVKVCVVVGTAPLKEMLKKEIGFGTTWTGLWIA